MSEMVERAAKALMSVDNAHPGQDHWPDEWEERAHAVIEAMREPTEEMITEGLEKPRGMMDWREAVGVSWRAMIDAALK